MAVTVIDNPWIPHLPTAKQAKFLLIPTLEAFYGGAGGGGKSDALLMAAAQYVGTPGYAAILFRRTYTDLALPGALMDRAHEWWDGTEARWLAADKTWKFPSGATITFGYLENERDQYRYRSAEFQMIGFDELTDFVESQFRFLFSRLRRLKESDVPLRMRAASNPGGTGHDWVNQRYIVEGKEKNRPFIPAKISDNPYLDEESYRQSLAELDPVTRAQIEEGDWSVRPVGNKFKREWFEIVDDFPITAKQVRYWDLAATEPKKGKDPDWTAGGKLAELKGVYWIVDVKRTRSTPQGVEQLIKQTADIDGKAVDIWMEQEPGASGVNTIDHYARTVLKGFTFRGDKSTGSKEVRANPLSSAAEAGNVKLVRGPWINDFLDEIASFPNGGHDDQVDCVSGAQAKLAKPKARAGIWVPD